MFVEISEESVSQLFSEGEELAGYEIAFLEDFKNSESFRFQILLHFQQLMLDNRAILYREIKEMGD